MSKDKIESIGWQQVLEDIDNFHSINDDLIIFDKPVIRPSFGQPFKSESTVAIVTLSGTTKGSINLKEYEAKGPSLTIILSGQILEYEYISPDFSGFFIVLSKRFLDSLNIEEQFTAYLSTRDNPYMPLDPSEKEAMVSYYNMLQKMIIKLDEAKNPYKLEIARNLTKAFFYGFGYFFHLAHKPEKPRHEVLTDTFRQLVQDNFKKERALEFYARKLHITPKYMSLIVKKDSGKAASEWIEAHIIMEAKALLKSTNMTIQQISDELNFPNQSFFGKYFKRLVGVSPKEYRRS